MTPCRRASHRVPLTVLQELCAILPRSRGRALRHRQEQGTVVLGLPGSVPVSAAPSGLSPSLCLGLAVSDGVAVAAGGAMRGPPPREALRGRARPWGPCPGMLRAQGDGVLGHRGLLAPRPPSADTAASIPSSLFIFRIPWQGRDCKQLIFSQGHLHPMALPRSHRRVAGCPVPPGGRGSPLLWHRWPRLLGAWQAPAGARAQPYDVPRSLLVSEEMRSLIVEKGPGPVEEDPDALVKGRRGATGVFLPPTPPRIHSWG